MILDHHIDPDAEYPEGTLKVNAFFLIMKGGCRGVSYLSKIIEGGIAFTNHDKRRNVHATFLRRVHIP